MEIFITIWCKIFYLPMSCLDIEVIPLAVLYLCKTWWLLLEEKHIFQSSVVWIVTLQSCRWISKIQRNMVPPSSKHEIFVSTYKTARCQQYKRPHSKQSVPWKPENLFDSSVVRRVEDGQNTEELHNIVSQSNANRMIQWRKMKWVGCVAYMVWMRNA